MTPCRTGGYGPYGGSKALTFAKNAIVRADHMFEWAGVQHLHCFYCDAWNPNYPYSEAKP